MMYINYVDKTSHIILSLLYAYVEYSFMSWNKIILDQKNLLGKIDNEL